MSVGYRDRKAEITLDTPVASDNATLIRSPLRMVKISVMVQADSSTPVTNSAGTSSSSVPLVKRPCWLSSAMVMEMRAEERSCSSPFCQV